MDARSTRAASVAFRTLAGVLGLITLSFLGDSLMAAGVRTQNFIVAARHPDYARRVAEAAERYRAELAIEWLGEELPPWSEPCPIDVKDAPHLGAGGATSFMFDRGRPFGWTMSIQGSRQRILDSVLPHEITHTIFATHFGQPVPRWADEGACTTVEHTSERAKQQQFLLEFLTTGRGIPFNRMFRMTEYPHDIMPLYSQGHSVAQYLLGKGGKRRFVDFVGHGMATHNWDKAIHRFYGFDDLSDLQLTWVDWVRQGSPAQQQQIEALADASPATQSQPLRVAEASPASNHGRDARGVAASFASTTVASHSNGAGWYAQQRDKSRPEHQQGFGPVSDRGMVASRQAARAQESQTTQERVLQWNRQSPVGTLAPMAAAPSVPPGYAPRGLPLPPKAGMGEGSPAVQRSGAVGTRWSHSENVWR